MKTLITAFIMFVIFTNPGVSANGILSEQEEVKINALGWKTAVINKDIDMLIKYARPESKVIIEVLLASSVSDYTDSLL